MAGCVAVALVISATCVALEEVAGRLAPGEFDFIYLFTTIAAMIYGVIPGLIAIFATRARRHPWLAMPWFAAGALAGVAAFALSAYDRGPGTDYRIIEEPYIGLAIAVIAYQVVDLLRTRGATEGAR